MVCIFILQFSPKSNCQRPSKSSILNILFKKWRFKYYRISFKIYKGEISLYSPFLSKSEASLVTGPGTVVVP